MTLVAGAFAYDPSAALDTANLRCLRAFFEPLAASGTLHQFESKALSVFKWDSEAHREPAWLATDDGSLTTLVGDPLLQHEGKRLPRMVQLETMRSADGGLDPAALAQARGVFVAIRFDAATSKLSVATDLIGVRPFYYTCQDGVFYFSSALHLLETLPRLRRRLDDKGLLEYLALSFSLADRTPYRDIALLTESSTLQVDRSGVTRASYFNWSAVTVVEESQEACAARLFSSFEDAVRLRLNEDKSAGAFLSGGMDSRAIVAALVAQGSRVQALNFSPDHTQDQLFAVNYARALGDRCELALHTRPDNPNFSLLASQALVVSAASGSEGATARKGQCLWSGDGGSVCLGSVYLDDDMVRLAHEGAWNEAAHLFLSKNRVHVPHRMLASTWQESSMEQLAQRVQSEILRYDNGDPGRGLYFFLLFNDQRRHLHKHFETIHLHALEFHLPFFDAAFVRSVVQSPAAWGIAHRLYSRWFSHFDATTRVTPWQTYPGHEPCPIESTDKVRYQWGSELRVENRMRWAQRCADSVALMRSARASALRSRLDVASIVSAALLHAASLRNLNYLATAARRLNALRPTD